MGLPPLLDWLDAGLNLHDYAAADKVVGNAAAFLYVLLHIGALHAEVLSHAALRTLQQHHIPVTYTTLTETIRNREQTGSCPMEAAVAGITDPQEAYTAIRKRLAEITKK